MYIYILCNMQPDLDELLNIAIDLSTVVYEFILASVHVIRSSEMDPNRVGTYALELILQ